MDGKLQELMERACQLGRLLPDENDIEPTTPIRSPGSKLFLPNLKKPRPPCGREYENRMPNPEQPWSKLPIKRPER